MRPGSRSLGRRSMVAGLVALATVAVLGVTPALALDLDGAKAQGWIGERRDGYVGLADAAASAEARGLVDQVNAERRAAYESVARQNGVPREQVEALAGQKLIGRAAGGTFVMDAAGRWIRK
ncbi:MAG TPA: YdbL family protein [Thalassobaculum sp.]